MGEDTYANPYLFVTTPLWRQNTDREIMRRVRAAIVLAGCLLTTLCVLFPACGNPDDNFGPGCMWLGTALKPTYDYVDRIDIYWELVAIEIGLAVLLSGVAYRATYFHRRKALVYAGVSLFLPLVAGGCAHLPWLLTRGFTVGFINYWVILSMEVYLLIAFLIGVVLLRKQRRGRLIKLGVLGQVAPIGRIYEEET